MGLEFTNVIILITNLLTDRQPSKKKMIIFYIAISCASFLNIANMFLTYPL